MKKSLPLVVILLMNMALAQKPAELLEKLRDSFPQERVYIHFDKEAYQVGETIWFKAYLFQGFHLSDLSTNFYVDLLDSAGNLLLTRQFPINGSAVSGSVPLPVSLLSGTYLFRAYTPWMLNFDPEFLYSRAIKVYSGKQVSRTDVLKAKPAKRFYLFPEGGQLVAGLVNVVAFKGTDEYGMPVSLKGKLLDGSGNELAQYESVHDGMGSFGFLPMEGQQYQAQVEFDDGTPLKIPLPAINKEGWLLQVREESAGKLRISVLGKKGQQEIPLVLIGQMQNELVVEQNISLKDGLFSIVFTTSNLPSGILQLTLLSEKGIPVAERLAFINNREYQLGVNLQTDSISLQRKGKNVFHFTLPDSLTGNFSVSIVDADRALQAEEQDNIITSYLVTGDLKGYIHRPAYYLKSNDKKTRSYLDLVMMTNGWRRFNWQRLWSQEFPLIRYRDRNHLEISGTLLSNKTNKPITEGEVNFLYRTKDSVTDIIQAEIMEEGRFFLDNLQFSDTAQFSFQYNSKKNKEKELLIRLDKDTIDFHQLAATVLDKQFSGFRFPLYTIADSTKVRYTFAGDTSGNYKMLTAVTVMAKKKRPLDELNRRYTTGLFSSNIMVKILDLVNSNDGNGSLNVFQYIQGRLPGIMVTTRGFPPTYTVYSRRAMNITKGLIPIPLYLDEVAAEPSQIANIPMNQVAMIKYFPTGFMGNSSIGTTQAIAVYTRKPTDRKDIGYSYLKSFSYYGYSPVKEFFSPDYEVNLSQKDLPDRRITILWQSAVEPDPDTNRYVIRFFNSDYARRLHLVLEGVASNGQLIREEKSIE